LTVIWERALRPLPGDTRVIGYCAVFKVRREAYTSHRGPGPSPASCRRGAGLSKLNSMWAASPQTRRSQRAACQARSTCLAAERAEEGAAELRELKAAILPALGAPEGAP